MFKNTAGQKLTVYAWDSATGLPKTGDAANLTAYRSLDDGVVTVLTDTSATETDATNAKGYYLFDLSQAETNGDKIAFSAKSSTSGIVVLAVPAVVQTVPNGWVIPRVTLVDTTTTNTDMRGTDGAYTGTPPTASAISTQVNSDITTAHGAGSYQTATGFSTHSAADVWAVATRTLSGTLGSFDALWNKVKAWLGALAGKTADTDTRAEINATTAGAGYNETTDSLQAVRDRGDAAWTGGGGDTTVNVMPVSGAATIGNVLDGGRIKGQYGAPLTGLTITCTTTNAGVTSARDLTAYSGALALVVFENDDTMDYGTRIVNGADITVSANVATISSTASHVLNTLLGENLRWCLRQDTAAPSIVFAIGDYTCQRAPVTVE